MKWDRRAMKRASELEVLDQLPKEEGFSSWKSNCSAHIHGFGVWRCCSGISIPFEICSLIPNERPVQPKVVAVEGRPKPGGARHL